jgi:hypothetical protein
MSAYKLSLRVVIGEVKRAFFWSAPAERGGDGALDRFSRSRSKDFNPKRRRRCALPAHSKLRST